MASEKMITAEQRTKRIIADQPLGTTFDDAMRFCTEQIKEAEQAAYERGLTECVGICNEKIAREIDLAKGMKGHAVFQAQAAIDISGEIAEEIEALKSEEKA